MKNQFEFKVFSFSPNLVRNISIDQWHSLRHYYLRLQGRLVADALGEPRDIAANHGIQLDMKTQKKSA
jgi:hypothetical protein